MKTFRDVIHSTRGVRRARVRHRRANDKAGITPGLYASPLGGGTMSAATFRA
jgi:hypothetical protein